MASEDTKAPTSQSLRIQQAVAIASQVVVIVSALAVVVGWTSGFVDWMLDRVVVSRIEEQLNYSVRLFNVDNEMNLMVNETTVMVCRIRQPDSCYFTPREFEEHLREGENSVAVDLRNTGGGSCLWIRGVEERGSSVCKELRVGR